MRDVSKLTSGNKLICAWTVRKVCFWCYFAELSLWIHRSLGACRNISVLHLQMLWMMWRQSC